MTSPIIGYTLDYETAQTYSKLPWYAIRENYFASVSALGGVPIGLPYAMEQCEAYLDLIDGLVVIGGDFDIDPKHYGGGAKHETVNLKENRTAFEWAMCEGALKRHIPILGICGGQQLLAVALGGSLIQHIPDEMPSDIAHEQPNPRDQVGHSVDVARGTLLHSIVGSESIGVNSAHHQAVKSVPEGVIISGKALDGIIEAIELPTTKHPFCLGVQWHPEYHVTPADDLIWRAFLQASEASR